jgi:hypothetical protein
VKAVGDELVHVCPTFLIAMPELKKFQGKVDKVVIVIKDKQEVSLERFIISTESMIQVEGFNKDTPFVDRLDWMDQ